MRTQVAIFAVVLSCASAFAGSVDVGIPTKAVDTPKEFWKRFMVRQYGAYNTAKKCWVSHSGGETYCMRPNALERVDVAGKPMVFVTARGAPSSSADGCHACTGTLGYFVLDASQPNLVMAAKSDPYLESGSYGKAAAEDDIKVTEIGPNHTFGWTERENDFGQGINVTYMTVKAILGKEVRSIGGAVVAYDDNEGCENGKNGLTGKGCSNLTLDPSFDPKAKDQFSPLVLHAHGQWQGAPFEKVFTLRFDNKKGAYVPPSDMPEELQQP